MKTTRTELAGELRKHLPDTTSERFASYGQPSKRQKNMESTLTRTVLRHGYTISLWSGGSCWVELQRMARCFSSVECAGRTNSDLHARSFWVYFLLSRAIMGMLCVQRRCRIISVCESSCVRFRWPRPDRSFFLFTSSSLAPFPPQEASKLFAHHTTTSLVEHLWYFVRQIRNNVIRTFFNLHTVRYRMRLDTRTSLASDFTNLLRFLWRPHRG